MRECPDNGACHHDCPAGECFRVRSCLPLSSYGEDWTEADKATYGGVPTEPTVEDVLTKPNMIDARDLRVAKRVTPDGTEW